MNLKIVLAAAVIISGGSFASYAQTTPTVTAVSAAKTFAGKIAAYEKETNATKAATLLDGIKSDMMKGMDKAKADFSTARGTVDNATSEKLFKVYDQRAQSLNAVSKTGASKTAIVAGLKQYAQTL